MELRQDGEQCEHGDDGPGVLLFRITAKSARMKRMVNSGRIPVCQTSRQLKIARGNTAKKAAAYAATKTPKYSLAKR